MVKALEGEAGMAVGESDDAAIIETVAQDEAAHDSVVTMGVHT